MYVGRIVVVGRTPEGKNVAGYRVSSRSFPNREARAMDDKGTVAIMPIPGHENDLFKNPYIAYNCVRLTKDWIVATNGSHTDPITEKILANMPVRDALALGLLAMDYEKDQLSTPRIAAIVPKIGDTAFLGIVRHDALMVVPIELKAGKASYVATYEHNTPGLYDEPAFTAGNPEDICGHLFTGGIFADLEKPVTAVAVVSDGKTLSFGIR